jgi:hypothetical protein
MSVFIKDAWSNSSFGRKPTTTNPPMPIMQSAPPMTYSANNEYNQMQQMQQMQQPENNQDIQSIMQYQQQLSQNQLEQVANYLSTVVLNLETSVNKKVDFYGQQVKEITNDFHSHSDRLDNIINTSYIIIAVIIIVGITVALVLFFYIKCATSKVLNEFSAVTKNVINSANLELLPGL